LAILDKWLAIQRICPQFFFLVLGAFQSGERFLSPPNKLADRRGAILPFLPNDLEILIKGLIGTSLQSRGDTGQ
jgi:hypothetical protein